MKTVLAALALAVLFAPMTSSAAALYGDMSGTTTINVGTGSGTDDSGDTPDDSDATSSPATGSANDDSNQGASGSGEVRLRTNALGIAIMGSGQVTSDEDLEIYRDNLKVEDEDFADASIDSDDNVDVAYYHEGKFLGLFPMRVKSHTKVTMGADGKVQVKTHLPWWSFLVTGTGNVSSSVDEKLAANGMVESDFKLGGNAAAKARILEAIANAHLQAGVTAR